MELLFTLAELAAIVLALQVQFSRTGKRLSFRIKCWMFNALVFCMTTLWCVV